LLPVDLVLRAEELDAGQTSVAALPQHY